MGEEGVARGVAEDGVEVSHINLREERLLIKLFQHGLGVSADQHVVDGDVRVELLLASAFDVGAAIGEQSAEPHRFRHEELGELAACCTPSLDESI